MTDLELRPTRLIRALSWASPAALLGLGAYGVLAGEGRGPGPWLLAGGVLLLMAAALALPWRTTIGSEGLDRRTWLRQHRIPWAEVVAFERHRGRRTGALVVRTTAGRRLALSDAAERPAEWDRLRELVARHGPGIALPPPPEAHPFHDRAAGTAPPGPRRRGSPGRPG